MDDGHVIIFQLYPKLYILQNWIQKITSRPAYHLFKNGGRTSGWA